MRLRIDAILLLLLILTTSVMMSRAEAGGYWRSGLYESTDPGIVCEQFINSYFPHHHEIYDHYEMAHPNVAECYIHSDDDPGTVTQFGSVAYICDTTEAPRARVTSVIAGNICQQDENGGMCEYSSDGQYFIKDGTKYGIYGIEGQCTTQSGDIGDVPSIENQQTGEKNTTLSGSSVVVAHDRDGDGKSESQIAFDPGSVQQSGCGYFNDEYVCVSSTDPTNNNGVDSAYYISDGQGNIMAGWTESNGSQASANFTTGYAPNGWDSSGQQSLPSAGSSPGTGSPPPSAGSGTSTTNYTTVINPDGSTTTTGTESIDLNIPSADEIANAIGDKFGCVGDGCGSLTGEIGVFDDLTDDVALSKSDLRSEWDTYRAQLESELGINFPNGSCSDLSVPIGGQVVQLGICDYPDFWAVLRALVLLTAGFSAVMIVLGSRG